MTLLHSIMRVICIGEVMIVLTVFIFGSHGINTYRKLRQENVLLQTDITLLKEELEKLHEQQALWQSYAQFYYEQFAREKLHMAYKDDIIYFTS